MKIHIHYKSGPPVAAQRDLLNTLLYASVEAREKDKHEIALVELKKRCPVSHNDKELRACISALLHTIAVFTWNEGERKQGLSAFANTTTSILRGITLDKGKLTYAFSPEFARHMQDPDIRAYIEQLVARQFRSKYAMNLYRYCLGYHKDPKAVGRTPFISLPDLQKVLGCEKEKSYGKYSEFNRSVLKSAISEINQGTDLHVQVSAYQRNANSITAIRLTIVSKDTYLKRAAVISKSTKTVTLDEIINAWEDSGGGQA